MGILRTYKEFKDFEPTYNKWRQDYELREKKLQKVLVNKPVTQDALKEQQRAKILVDVYTSLDEYAQNKAEDVDSVSQTLLYISLGALGAIGTAIGEKVSGAVKNPKFAKTLPSILGIGVGLAGILPIIRTTVNNQVRANRIARFEGMHEKLFDTNNFAIFNDYCSERTTIVIMYSFIGFF